MTERADEAWRAGFLAALYAAITAHGYVKHAKPQPWKQDDHSRTFAAQHHLSHCAADVARSSYEETGYLAWGGTMSGDTYEQCVEAVLWCACGHIDGWTWRYEDGFASLLRLILEAEK